MRVPRQQLLRWGGLALLLAALIWLAWALIAVKAFGLGVALIMLWVGTLAWMVWRHHLSSFPQRWNRWLGAILLTLALFGLLAFFRPQDLTVRVSLAEFTLGGLFGQIIIGSPGFSSVRVVVLSLAGIVFLAPGSTRRLLSALAAGFSRLHRRQPTPQVQVQKASIWESPWLRVTKTANPPSPRNPVELLAKTAEIKSVQVDNEERARLIEQALASYGVEARVVQVNPGPAVTQFGVEPGWDRKYKKIIERGLDGKVKLDRGGKPISHLEEVSRTRVKIERITSLSNDLALALAVPSIRMEAPVPGKSVIGVEVPNPAKTLVPLREVIESTAFQSLKAKSKLAIALGQGAGGEAVVGDLAQMPHMLIAGATGSGKTVCLSSIIACLLVNTTPNEVRLLLIDPKRVELAAFNDLPHLLTPVVFDLEGAVGALRRVNWEMESRYRKLSSVSAHNVETYNKKVKEKLPYLVVIIDELADLMAAAADVVEPFICRLAQLSRATGIHLIIATQRPSVDVITGLIKANFPTRISFAVPSHIDSRTILDIGGAEKLLGSGDMLYLPIGTGKPKRLQGAFVSEQEIKRLVQSWRHWREPSGDSIARAFASLEPVEGPGVDTLLEEARRLAIEHKRISTSFLQRRLRIGYPRAARLIDLLEEEGVVSSGEPGKAREVLG